MCGGCEFQETCISGVVDKNSHVRLSLKFVLNVIVRVKISFESLTDE